VPGELLGAQVVEAPAVGDQVVLDGSLMLVKEI
jgi:hypothetical protein